MNQLIDEISLLGEAANSLKVISFYCTQIVFFFRKFFLFIKNQALDHQK